jgi:hypothetical protein
LFHNSNVFGSCIIHILYAGCAKIKKNNSGAKRFRMNKHGSLPSIEWHSGMSSIKKKPQRELFEGVGGFKI